MTKEELEKYILVYYTSYSPRMEALRKSPASNTTTVLDHPSPEHYSYSNIKLEFI